MPDGHKFVHARIKDIEQGVFAVIGSAKPIQHVRNAELRIIDNGEPHS